MGQFIAYVNRGLLLVAITGGVVIPAFAQRPARRSTQPILFSAPGNNDVATNNASLLPRAPESSELMGVIEAPAQINFSRLSSPEPLPTMVTLPSPVEVMRERNILDRRRNWALLTPAEILGVDTPEKVLGVTERDAFGQPKNLTAMERYTERLNQLLSPARTNAAPADNAATTWLYPDGGRSGSNFLSAKWRSAQSMGSSPFNPAPNTQPQAALNENQGWSRLFNIAPAPLAQGPDTARDEDIERFRQLLNPDTVSAAAGATPALGGLKTTLPQGLLNAGLAQSAKADGPFAPLRSGIGKPPELPKLPGVLSVTYTSPPVAPWAPQPAPWLSPGPQPFAAPQRKF